MASAIAQLQQDALDRRVPLSDLLRRALVIARKLDLREFQTWIEHELAGYGDQPSAPRYREVSGQVMGWNPYRGWVPVQFERQSDRDFYSRRKSGQSIAEIEALVEGGNGGQYQMPFPNDPTVSFGGTSMPTRMSLFTSRSALVGILDAVRTIVLNWALKLEEQGVHGEGLTFTPPEKEAAHHSSQAITNFFGPVQSAQVQQGNAQAVQVSVSQEIDAEAVRVFLEALRAKLPQLSLEGDAEAEAEAETRTIEAQLASPKPKPSIIREGLRSLRTILEGAAGGAGGQLLLELAKLLAS